MNLLGGVGWKRGSKGGGWQGLGLSSLFMGLIRESQRKRKQLQIQRLRQDISQFPCLDNVLTAIFVVISTPALGARITHIKLQQPASPSLKPLPLTSPPTPQPTTRSDRACVFQNLPINNQKKIELALISKGMTLRSKDVNAQQGGEEHHNRNDHNLQFYEEYKKIFATGYYLSLQLKQMVQSKEDLWRQLLGFEKRAEEEFRDKMRKEAPERKKRFRRTADEIEKAFVCQAEKCQRSYGSEGSLFQHIKLKHPEIYAKMSRAEQERHLGLPADPESNP